MEETLGLRGIGFSPMFALLKPTFSLLFDPTSFSKSLHLLKQNAPLPRSIFTESPIASANDLVPDIFGASTLELTSELLRILSRIAASKRTFWLFLR